jgi:hypothetical protein
VPQAQGGPRHRYYSGLVAFRSRDGSPTNRLKRSCIHGTYFTHCAWCRLSPTPPGGPSEVTDLMAASAPYREVGGADSMAPSGCAPKSVGTRKSPAYFARRLATAGLQFTPVMMTRTRVIQRFIRVKFTLFRRTSAEVFFSCCGSVAAPRERPGHHDQVPAKKNERCREYRPRHHGQVSATQNGCRRGQRPGDHAQLPATHNERRRGQQPGATIKYLRRSTSAAAGSGRAQ